MLLRDLKMYIDGLSEDSELAIFVRSIETGKEFGLSHAVAADISEYNELMLSIDIELCAGCPFLQKYDRKKNDAARCILFLPYADFSFDTMRKRRLTVKSVMVLLEAIRIAQSKALENTPNNFRDSDNFEAGEFAVDALEQAIDTLADIV
jgi:hypothetical protein